MTYTAFRDRIETIPACTYDLRVQRLQRVPNWISSSLSSFRKVRGA